MPLMSFRAALRQVPDAAKRLREAFAAYSEPKEGDPNPITLVTLLEIYREYLMIRAIADRALDDVEVGRQFVITDLKGKPAVKTDHWSMTPLPPGGLISIPQPHQLSREQRMAISRQLKEWTAGATWREDPEHPNHGNPAPMDFGQGLTGLRFIGHQSSHIGARYKMNEAGEYELDASGRRIEIQEVRNLAYDIPLKQKNNRGRLCFLVGSRPTGEPAIPGGFSEGMGKSKAFGEFIEETVTGAADFCRPGSRTGTLLDKLNPKMFSKALINAVKGIKDYKLRAELSGILLEMYMSDNPPANAPALTALTDQLEAAGRSDTNLLAEVSKVGFELKMSLFQQTDEYKAARRLFDDNCIKLRVRPNLSDIRNTPNAWMNTIVMVPRLTDERVAFIFTSMGFTKITGGDDLESAKWASMDHIVNGVTNKAGRKDSTFCDHPELVIESILVDLIVYQDEDGNTYQPIYNEEDNGIVADVSETIQHSLDIFEKRAERYQAALSYAPGMAFEAPPKQGQPQHVPQLKAEEAARAGGAKGPQGDLGAKGVAGNPQGFLARSSATTREPDPVVDQKRTPYSVTANQ